VVFDDFAGRGGEEALGGDGMSERAKSSGIAVQLLIAAVVLVLGFGGGALLGRATGERKPRATDPGGSVLSVGEATEKLAACRSGLKALAKPQATASATATAPVGESGDADAGRASRAEALQKEVDACRVRETLSKAYVCGTMTDHDNLLFVLAYSSSCEDEAGVGDFIIQSFDKCAEFNALPGHLDEKQLTQQERMRIAESRRNQQYKGREDVAKGVRESLRRCREKFGLPAK